MTSRTRSADSGQRRFLRRILLEAAERLGVTPVGPVVFGWRDRTIGSAAHAKGGRFWLRTTAEHDDWAGGEAWFGNRDAAAIIGVPKPALIDRVEWAEPPVVIYGELLTYVPDQPCSLTPELAAPVALPAAWWSELRGALDVLAATPTMRGDHDPRDAVRRVEEFYGQSIDTPTPVLRTEHTDLHWANLTQPQLHILDWEYWGTAPAGYGAAVLYLHSLPIPDLAARVHETFADLLDTPTGRLAQLSAAAHILDRATGGDYPTLSGPVRAYAADLLQPAKRR
ncbi:aminoglycoside phosphotransferase [Microtetraspora sp. AC03309]|uniref:aminoglycoside phosphotransferase n=1 Tax=Microtetraspora sp. AC03309 TaxID=2779376 RepID=UPI001E4A86EE|nr:aminoglycoside phosphotransferase [Microtetraspora sp. AC03309]MCC5580565.1 aminoglycoside phosphotransferase [Microtetraspora sp. AC03309]